ncbi:MAG: hypothetical protein SGILL_002553 [Bacillariaceae sp.]
MSSRKTKTPTAYTIQSDDDDSDDEAELQALAKVKADLSEYTAQPAAAGYGPMAMDWMEEEELKASSPKRTPLMQRSTTPIMSNSSHNKNKSRKKSSTTASSSKNDDDSDIVMDYIQPAPVETPMILERNLAPKSGRRDNSGGASARRISYGASSSSPHSLVPLSPSLSQNSFRRYHDALWRYLQTKRRLDTQIDLERADNALTDGTNTGESGTALVLSASLPEQQSKAEIDFCKTLSQLGYSLATSNDDTENIEEGHAWKLLAELRKLSIEALIWVDDSSSLTQHESTVSFFVRPLTTKVKATPKEILEELKTSRSASLPLKRKLLLVQWIQSCLEQESKEHKAELPRSSSSSLAQGSHLDDPNPPALTSEMDEHILRMLMQTCLDEVLEGSVAKACELAKTHGHVLKAALWSGGEPYGYKTVLDDDIQTADKIPIGNPNRFLWKRQVWKTGRRMLQQQQQQLVGTDSSSSVLASTEAAIYSILANDVNNSLSNPLIRGSWSKSLCVLLTGMWERIQDEILHSHSSNRRRSPPPGYPGSQYEDEEKEQLVETSELAGIKEAQIASRLQSSPFLQQQQRQKEEHVGPKVSYKDAMLAFIVGRSAIAEFSSTATDRLLSGTSLAFFTSSDGGRVNREQDWKGLRFLTHLILFLDSFDVSTAHVRTNDLTQSKNQILFDYIRYMESRPDLWHMLALYVSMLPHSKILDYFPSVLAQVYNSSERKKMMDQIRELMPTLELPLLRKVVRIMLAMHDLGGERDEDMDGIKFNSLEWLLENEKHLGDALICSNIFMRELLLAEDEDKMDSAMRFLSDRSLQGLADEVADIVHANDSGDYDSLYVSKVSNARIEHFAYASYFEAYHAFERWKDVLKETPTALGKNKAIDKSALNATERGIADRTFQKNWIREKKALFETVIEGAERARSALDKVLTHPGGWLSLDGDDETVDLTVAASDNEEYTRKEEIARIRSRHLVLAVNLYHQVCEDTASWISRSYDEAESVGVARDQVLFMLDGDVQTESGAAESSFSPKFWYQCALNLSTLVAMDSYGIYKAFSPDDLKDLLSKIAETAVAELLNA